MLPDHSLSWKEVNHLLPWKGVNHLLPWKEVKYYHNTTFFMEAYHGSKFISMEALMEENILCRVSVVDPKNVNNAIITMILFILILARRFLKLRHFGSNIYFSINFSFLNELVPGTAVRQGMYTYLCYKTHLGYVIG